MITKVYYSLANGGDGSGYPIWFEDKICSEFHQSLQEGWGEDCSGYIEIESDGPVKVKEATSYKDYVNELKEELEECRHMFVAVFFMWIYTMLVIIFK